MHGICLFLDDTSCFVLTRNFDVHRSDAYGLTISHVFAGSG